MSSDNFHIDITHSGDLTDAMKIAFAGCPGGKASAFSVDPVKGLVFLWAPSKRDASSTDKVTFLPFGLDAIGAADFARRWLAEQDYGREPDHDGDNSKGWRLYNEAWAHVADYAYGFIAVKPAWMMHGQ